MHIQFSFAIYIYLNVGKLIQYSLLHHIHPNKQSISLATYTHLTVVFPCSPKKKNTCFPHPGPPRNRPAGDDSLVGAVEVADAEGGLGAVPE
jgi:hypothetical protein